MRPDPERSQNVDSSLPENAGDDQQMHATLTQEQIRYRLMQQKYEEHQKLMARVEEHKQKMEQERLAAASATLQNERKDEESTN